MRRLGLAAALCLLTGCASMPVQVGQSYLFAYDCVPEAIAALVARQMEQSVNPCYVEVVRVLKKRGQWIDLAVSGGLVWTVNSAQVGSFTPVETGPAPAASEPQSAPAPAPRTMKPGQQQVRRTP